MIPLLTRRRKLH